MTGVAPGVILASASPRRHDLLTAAGLDHVVVPANIDETPPPGVTDPVAIVADLAHRKALAVGTRHRDALVLAADTLVAVDGVILGQPASADDAVAMVGQLAGRSHHVHTGMAVARHGRVAAATVASATVEVAAMDDEALTAYVAAGLWRGKAGGYGIQDAVLPARIVAGRMDTVMGLDVEAARSLLAASQQT